MPFKDESDVKELLCKKKIVRKKKKHGKKRSFEQSLTFLDAIMALKPFVHSVRSISKILVFKFTQRITNLALKTVEIVRKLWIVGIFSYNWLFRTPSSHLGPWYMYGRTKTLRSGVLHIIPSWNHHNYASACLWRLPERENSNFYGNFGRHLGFWGLNPKIELGNRQIRFQQGRISLEPPVTNL